ncbi:PEP-CTERM sorting domain-containing protein [Lacipirellula sp.]|uniref:PEP-CTERM sorting domain-containing protein n=1 Tax=Lacipirellula sp. TaxID=2691419 RepID=UPI003D1444BD
MQRSSVAALALMVALTSVNVSHATKFAVLLGSPQGSAVIAPNPLYTSNEPEVNPLFHHDIPELGFSPTELWQGAPATLEVLFTDSLPDDLPPAPKGALVFGVSLIDQATGNAIHKLRTPVTIAVEFDRPADPSSFVFGSLNESTGVWGEFQKGKPKQGSTSSVCGTTDHFSFFYIAAVPEPSTLTLALAAGALGVVRRRR